MVKGVIRKETHYSLLKGVSISLDVNLQKLGLFIVLTLHLCLKILTLVWLDWEVRWF